MNLKLTRTAKFFGTFAACLIVAVLFVLPSAAFSETCAAKNADVLYQADTHTPSYGPVDVTLVKNGDETAYTFFPVECSAFLTYAGVVLTEIDSVSVKADTVLYDNMMIDVSTVEYSEYTVTEDAPYDYDLIPVDTVPKGEMNVLTEGTPGKKNVTYIEKRVGGEVTEREVIGEEMLSYPVNGTAEYGVGGSVTASDGTVYNYSYKKYMEATAYTYVPGKTTMTTATGERLRKGIVAVDPKVIPMHTKMYIASDTVEYGLGQAEDTGGVIKGNIVDLAYMSYDECIQFGRRYMWVYILEE